MSVIPGMKMSGGFSSSGILDAKIKINFDKISTISSLC